MAIYRFWSRIRSYGLKRILFDTDLLLSVAFILGVTVIEVLSCNIASIDCIRFASLEFVDSATELAISFTIFIVSGLAILVAFTDSRFISELKDIGIYQNIMFIFEYTIFITAITSIAGIVVYSYSITQPGFYLFLFLFTYMTLSVLNLVQLIVTFGNKKAKFELQGSD